MNPPANTGWRKLNPAAVPTYMAIESGPWLLTRPRTRVPMSVRASAHVAAS